MKLSCPLFTYFFGDNHGLKRLSFAIWAYFLVAVPFLGSAQIILNHNCSNDVITFENQYKDLYIGDQVTDIALTLKGADGGNAVLYAQGACDVLVKGGEGATVYVSFPIGSGSNRLQPGGVLRIFVGQVGQTTTSPCLPLNPGIYGGGGGGSSAILYLPPAFLGHVMSTSHPKTSSTTPAATSNRQTRQTSRPNSLIIQL